MAEPQDIQRLRIEYADRIVKYSENNKYSLLDQTQLFFLQNRKRKLLSILQKFTTNSLINSKLLEIGCGSGGVLVEYFSLGASLRKLYGIDLLFDRLKEAKEKLPTSHIQNANGEFIPYRNSSFDFVLQYTAFSSILDPSIKQNVAEEMLRVLKKPDGLIIWYDFWLNPTNLHTKGIRKKEIRELFPNCTYDFNKITLAPPLARKLVPISWIFSQLLEKFGIFNTHYLVLIKPKV